MSFVFFKQKTAYEIKECDWSSDVCSSDLTLPAPLKDRGGEVELSVPSVEDWTKDFAIPNKIDGRIIGYLNFKPSSLRKVDFEDNQKFVTPRGWERVNQLIKDVKGYSNLNLICKSAIGEGIAHEFISFCKIQEKMKLEEVIKNPKKIAAHVLWEVFATYCQIQSFSILRLFQGILQIQNVRKIA